jgi:hypothetical protein
VEEQFVKTEHLLFVGSALPTATEEERRFIENEIARQSDDAVLEADLEEWAGALAAESQLAAPRVETEKLRRGESDASKSTARGRRGSGSR